MCRLSQPVCSCTLNARLPRYIASKVGGKHCNAEMFAVPELKRAIRKEMAMEPERTVRPPLLWLSFQEFEENISEMAKEVGHVEGVEDKKATSSLLPELLELPVRMWSIACRVVPTTSYAPHRKLQKRRKAEPQKPKAPTAQGRASEPPSAKDAAEKASFESSEFPPWLWDPWDLARATRHREQLLQRGDRKSRTR